MKSRNFYQFLFVVGFVLVSFTAYADPAATADTNVNVDLILPHGAAKSDQPFYVGASVKMGDTLIPVQEGKLPDGQLAAFLPEKNVVIVSDKKTTPNAEKGVALLNVLDAMQAGAVAPAAGKED